ncbi:MAG: zinc ribbon domain-containing protein [Oscillospiraceae bacterium]|nr:zinc ribbon domain-containing protein [Oscillospiraceae bacterium]
MERFCSKCGSLVSGSFCPQCGAPMESAVNLNKQEDVMPTANPSQPMGGSQPAGYSQPTYNNNANYAPMPNYPQNANVNFERTENMTVGQWVGTLILSQLGIIGLIFLLVWAFGDTPQPKKNFARGMLLAWVIIFAASMIIGLSCVGCMGIGLSEILESSYYYY